MTSRTFSIAVLTAAAAVAGVSAQDARPTPQFRFERPIHTAAGPQRLRIDVPILAQARRDLADLRISDAAGREVPYLLIPPAPPSLAWAPGRVAPIAATQKISGFEVDFGSLLTIDRIRFTGIAAPFMKRANVEGSGDRARWTVLRNQITVFDLPDYQLQQLEVPFAPGSYRYVRVTWDDRNSARVLRPAMVSARTSAQDAAPAAPLTAPIEFERRPSEPGKSRYHLRLPGPHLPLAALDLTVGGGYVLRRAVVTESRLSDGRMAPVITGATILRRIVQGDLSATALRIPIAKPDEPELDLTIDDGDNPPLDLKGVTAVFDELPRIYVESEGGELVARYGDARLGPPRYDLEAARDSVRIEKVADATWGVPRTREPAEGLASSTAAMPTGGAPIDAKRFRFFRAIPAGEAGLIALPLDAATLAHSSGPRSDFADLRVIDASERQVPYVLERRDEPLELPIVIEQRDAPPTGAQQSGAISYYRVRLPFSNLPSAQLVLTTSARVFERIAGLSVERPADARHRDTWISPIATARWAHAEQSRPAPALTLSVSPVDATELLLVVSEGDNSRLPITTARLLLPSYRIRLFRDDGAGALRMVYGRSDLGPPSYDLAILAPQVLGVSAREVRPAGEEAGAAAQPGLAASALMSPRVFWSVLVAAVIALVVLLMRLLKQQPPSAAT